MKQANLIETSDFLRKRRAELSREILLLQEERDPGMQALLGRKSMDQYLDSLEAFLSCLSAGIRYCSRALMEDWFLYASLEAFGEDASSVIDSMVEALEEAVSRTLGREAYLTVTGYLEACRRKWPRGIEKVESFLQRENPHADLARRYTHLLLEGLRREATHLILSGAEKGLTVREIYQHVFQPCLLEIGRLWQSNLINPGVEHFCTAVTQLNMSLLYDRIFSAERTGKRMVAACVAKEFHEIGVRMVSDFFEMEGWDTFYLGAGSPAESIWRMVEKREATLLCLSATMAASLPEIEAVIQIVREKAGHKIIILAGGRSFQIDPSLYQKVGADATAGTAWEAVEIVKRLELEESW